MMLSSRRMFPLLLSLFLCASSCHAAVLTVTNLNDSGMGSLREALSLASGTDVIVFQTGLSGTISLSSQLQISVGVTISGPSGTPGITIDGNNAVRGINVSTSLPSGSTVSISNLAITNCNALSSPFHGGGIYCSNSNVTLNLTNVTISNCFTGSTSASGGGMFAVINELSMSGCTLDGNWSGGSGGGIIVQAATSVTLNNCVINNNIAQSGPYGGGFSMPVVTGSPIVTITGCAITNNSASFGAGIYKAAGPLTMTDTTIGGNVGGDSPGVRLSSHNGQACVFRRCTFSTNQGSFGGGGVGIRNGGGTSTYLFENCTFSDNFIAGGAGSALFAEALSGMNLAVTLRNCTVADNTWNGSSGSSLLCTALTGGVCAFDYANSIFSGPGTTNIVASGTGTASVVSNNNNICSDTSGNLIQSNDQFNTAAQLAPLANNGGATKTRLPQSGSPAIDKGRFISGVAADQRGVVKPIDHALVPNASNGDGSDVGSVEVANAPVAPTVSQVVPGAGPLAGNQFVTVTGTNFTGATSVTFGGAAATGVVVVSSTTITCTTPTHAAGQVSVNVSTPAGTSAPNLFYSYLAAPTLTGCTPSSGPTAGGTMVVIAGTGFTSAFAVTFDGMAAFFTVISDTQITATSPPHTLGGVAVLITSPGGSNPTNTAFVYVNSIAVSGLAPASGPPTGGTSVVISGSSFTGANQVTFGGTTAGFVINSDTQITATAPAHASGTVDVIVTGPSGASPNTAADDFTYLVPVPEVDVFRGATPIADGLASDPLGAVTAGVGQTVSYTLSNTGTASLNLTGTPDLVVVTPGSNISSASISVQPTASIAASSTSAFTVAFTLVGAGAFSFSIRIDNTDTNENPYDWVVTGTGVVSAPEIDVTRSLTPIADGGSDNVGNIAPGLAFNLVYTLANTGNAPLNLSGGTIVVGMNCTANITTFPAGGVAPSGFTTCVVTVTPTAPGPFEFSISFSTNDSNENPYDWLVSGTSAVSGGGGGGIGGGGEGGGGCSTDEGLGLWTLAPALFAFAMAVCYGSRAARRRTQR